MQAVILAGGLATRLRPLTDKIPKSMIEIEGKPFLEYQLELLKKNSISDIILCIGYRGEQIKKYFGNGEKLGVEIRYSSDKNKLLGTGGALKGAENLLEDVFLVIYGDAYHFFDFQKMIKFFKKFDKLGLMTVFKNFNKYYQNNVEIEKNLIKTYSKKRKTKKMKYIEYGVSIFRKEALKFIPGNRFYDLSQLHKTLIKKRELLAYPAGKKILDIGSFEGLDEFKKYIKR